MTPLRAVPDDAMVARPPGESFVHTVAYDTILALTSEARECGYRQAFLELADNPARTVDLLRVALERMDQGRGASDESMLLMRRLAASVADDVASACKPDVDFSLRAHREGRG